MIDASIVFAPARDVIAVDLWEGALPDLGDARAIMVEPARWWVIAADASIEAIAARIGSRGAITPIGGGMMRAMLAGPGWRELLTISGFVDTDECSLVGGQVVRTVIHHVAVTIAVDAAAQGCEVYCAASYAPTLEALWRGATTER